MERCFKFERVTPTWAKKLSLYKTLSFLPFHIKINVFNLQCYSGILNLGLPEMPIRFMNLSPQMHVRKKVKNISIVMNYCLALGRLC